MPACRRCLRPLVERQPGVLGCPDGDGLLVDEAWLARTLSPSAFAAWTRGVAAATPTVRSCSACPGRLARVSFATSYPGSDGLRSWNVTAERCEACNRAWFPGATLGEIMDRGPLFDPPPNAHKLAGRCPRCNAPLDAEDRCPKRQGLLVRGAALERALGQDWPKVVALVATKRGRFLPWRCAACGTLTEPLRVEGRRVDACPHCGSVWLGAKAEDLAPRLADALRDMV